MKKYTKAEASIGKRYGKLVCTDVLPRKGTRRKAVFDCDCGKKNLTISLDKVKSGQKSCGCAKLTASTKHGLSGTRIYNIWRKMIERTSPNFYQSQNYYDRGILIEDKRWLDVQNFFADMGHPPEGLTLERIDNDKGYYKDNCRWATRRHQQANRRAKVTPQQHALFKRLRANGYTYAEISRMTGFSTKTVFTWVKRA